VKSSACQHVVVACGLLFEARIAAKCGNVIAHAGGGDGARLQYLITRSAEAGASGILSFGVAGALDPSLKAGDLVVASEVLAKDERIPTHAQWTAEVEERLAQGVPGGVRHAPVLGSDVPLSTALDKAHAFRLTGCAIVDMESQVAARVARTLGLPFAVLRAVADEADTGVPRAAIAGMRADGSTDVRAVLAALATDPRQTGALIRLARASGKARASLLRSVHLLGPAFACGDIR